MPVTGTQAIDRAAELLERVILADEPRGFSELVNDTGLAKSTASRLLQALERHSLIHRDDQGMYAAGSLFSTYARRHHRVDDLIGTARPTLAQLSAATGETVNLAVVQAGKVVQIDQIDSTFLLATTNWIGVEVPAHCSALGKVFYAAGVIEIASDLLERRTPHTLTTRAALQIELDRIREQGFAEALSELEIGLDAVAAPVYGDDGGVIAAIGVSGPSGRLSSQLPRLGALLVSHATALSAALAPHSDNGVLTTERRVSHDAR